MAKAGVRMPRPERVREDDASTARPGAVLINPFEVPDGEGDTFLPAWETARDAMGGADGYLGTRMYHSLAPNTLFGFVNVARWRSPSDSRRPWLIAV
jgi:heme-degrading monooxygenase HmoA